MLPYPPDQLRLSYDQRAGFTVRYKGADRWRSRVFIRQAEATLLSWTSSTFEGLPALRVVYHLEGFCCPVVVWLDPVSLARLD